MKPMQGKVFLAVLLSLILVVCGSVFGQEEDVENTGGQPVVTENSDMPADTDEIAAPVSEESNTQDPEEESKKVEETKKLNQKQGIQATAAASTGGTGGSGGISMESAGFLAAPTPDTSVFTGAAIYSIPIRVPGGRNGLTPSIALTYNSMRGNSWVAVGWDLDLGCIRRSTKRGLNYPNDEFVFESAGKSAELVDRSAVWGDNYYGAKIEEDFTKYYKNGTSWNATAKDGTKYFYGSASTSRIGTSSYVFKWCLDKIQDTNGNYIKIIYIKHEGQIYPSEIQYTGHESSDLAPIRFIKFILEDRDDRTVDYTTTVKVTNAKRLSAIEVYLNTTLTRRYELTHGYSPITKRSLLKSVTEYGSDNTGKLPPLKFTYQEGPALGSFEPEREQPLPAICSSKGGLSTCDVNGDSLADLYYSGYYEKLPDICGESPGGGEHCHPQQPISCPAYFETGLGNGNFTNHSEIGLMRAPDGYEIDPVDRTKVNCNLIASYRKTVGDLDGDGNQEIITVSRGSSSPMNINGHEYDIPYYDQPISTFDVNGDGYADLFFERDYKIKTVFRDCDGVNCGLQTVYEYKPTPFFLIGNGDGTFKPNKIGLGSFYNSQSTEDCNRTFGDFNGDNRTDMVFASNFSPHVKAVLFFGKGDGTFEEGPTTLVNSYYAPVSTMDLNNDGLSDLLIGAKVFPSKGDGTFETGGINLGDMQPIFSNFPLTLGDLNGDARNDIITATGIYFGKTGPYPDLLSKVENSMGGSAGLTYKCSTAYENKHLPFPLQTVYTITSDDGLGNRSGTTYTYAGGYYEPTEREFRGFASVTKTNPNNTKETTWFYQTKFYQGKSYRVELRESGAGFGGTLLSGTTMIWRVDYFDTAKTSGFVRPYYKMTESYDDQTVFTKERYYFDTENTALPKSQWAGNLTKTIITGTGAETITKENEYQDYGDWTWRTIRETLKNSQGVKLREITYTHDPATGNLLTQTFWLDGGESPVPHYAYDAYGNQTKAWDGRGYLTSTYYDPDTYTYPTKVVRPKTGDAVHITYYSWNELYGRLYKAIDENNKATVYSYDVFGRLHTAIHPDGGATVTYYYDSKRPCFTLTKVKENGGFILRYDFYDGFGRQVQTSTFGEEVNGAPKNIITRTYYDNMGRVSRTEGPFFAADYAYPQEPPTNGNYPYTQTSYDLRSRVSKIQIPHGDYTTPVAASFSYSGFSTTITDPDGAKKKEIRDHLGRIIEVVEYNGTTEYHTTYDYNAAGDLILVTDTYGKTTTLAYDTLGRKTEMTDPDMGHWTYTYDKNNNLSKQTDAKGQEIRYVYDHLNRPRYKYYQKDEQKNAPTVYYYYDNPTPDANGMGRPLSVVRSGVTQILYTTYDAMGRNTSVTKKIDGTAYTTKTEYDLSGKVTKIIYPDNYYVTYSYYPGSNLIKSVTGSDNVAYALYTDYEPTGKIGQVTHANGISTRYNYDAKSTRIFGIVTTSDPDDPTKDLQNKSYTYTKAGDIKQIVDHKRNRTYVYTYDKLHRLKTETGGPEAITYTYDAVGRILTRTIGTKTFTYEYEDTAHIHAVSGIVYNANTYNFTYDANGNMLTSPDLTDPAQVVTRTITYDPDNMPSQIVRSGVTVAFIYDGTGKRMKKTVSGGSTTLYIGEHYEIKDGAVVKYIFGGNLRIAMVKGTTTNYYHKDHLGSTAAITNQNGVSKEGTEYHPFGTMREHTGSNISAYKFTDQEADVETGLYNYDARLYDPVLGLFVTADSIVPNMYDPQTLNRYSYCRNNPMIYTDPTGHDHNWEGCDMTKEQIHDMVERDFRGNQIGLNWFQNWCRGRKIAKLEKIGIEINQQNLDNFYSIMDVVNLISKSKQLQNIIVDYLKKQGYEISTFGKNVWSDFVLTNKAVPGLTAPTGLGALFGAGNILADTYNTVTIGEWIGHCLAAGGFRGIVLEGVQFTALETGVLASATSFSGMLAVAVAYEGGVFIGSVINNTKVPGTNKIFKEVLADAIWELTHPKPEKWNGVVCY